MKGDDRKNIDAAAKVKAFRAEYPPDVAAVYTSWWPAEIAGELAVVGHARVVRLEDGALLSEAFATRGLRPLKAGVKGMQDTRDAERAQTGALGRALFLMGYGERPDDSADYEEPAEPVVLADKETHDSIRKALSLLRDSNSDAAHEVMAWWMEQGYPPIKSGDRLTPNQATAVLLAIKDYAEADSGAGDAGGETEREQTPVSTDELVGPDVPLLKVGK